MSIHPALEALLRPGVAPTQLAGIPCFFDDAAATRAGWSFEALHLLRHIESFGAESTQQAAQPGLDRLTRERLLSMAASHRERMDIVRALLAPLEPETIATHDFFNYVQGKGRLNSELLDTYFNLHRDWSWETTENEQMLAHVRSVLPDQPPGKVLALGAAGCRLPYDLHMALAPEMTVATEINPLPFLCAQRVLAGEEVALHEFPYNPVDARSYAIRRTLRAPRPVTEGFHLALTDATKPSFRPGSFDTVLTSWLIDVVPMDIHAFFPILNRLLRPGGLWVNAGPLLFQTQFASRYSLDEVIDVAAQAGFEIEAMRQQHLPYLVSPASCSHRSEWVVAFSARKLREVAASDGVDGAPASPAWLRDHTMPITIGADLRSMAVAQAAFTEILRLVDGRTSVAQIAAYLSAKLRTPLPQATVFVERTLTGLLAGLQSTPMRTPQPRKP